MTEPRQIGVVRDYQEFMTALRKRAHDLNIGRDAIDLIAGLPAGYAAKLLAPVPIRAIGPDSLGPLLATLGLSLVLVEDLTTFAKIAHRIQKRRRKWADASVRVRAYKRQRKRHVLRGNSEWGRLMVARKLLKMSPEQISRQNRAAANARWQGERHRKENAARAAKLAEQTPPSTEQTAIAGFTPINAFTPVID